jgi:hypothetical protein
MTVRRVLTTSIVREEWELDIYHNTRVCDITKQLAEIPMEGRLIETREGDSDNVEVVLAFRAEKGVSDDTRRA